MLCCPDNVFPKSWRHFLRVTVRNSTRKTVILREMDKMLHWMTTKPLSPLTYCRRRYSSSAFFNFCAATLLWVDKLRDCWLAIRIAFDETTVDMKRVEDIMVQFFLGKGVDFAGVFHILDLLYVWDIRSSCVLDFWSVVDRYICVTPTSAMARKSEPDLFLVRETPNTTVHLPSCRPGIIKKVSETWGTLMSPIW